MGEGITEIGLVLGSHALISLMPLPMGFTLHLYIDRCLYLVEINLTPFPMGVTLLLNIDRCFYLVETNHLVKL